MSNQDYQAMLEHFTAIPADDVKSPIIPVDVYLQEAENLYHWSQDDEAILTGAGLDWAMVGQLPVRAGALREAQSLWFKQRFSREDAAKQWQAASEQGYELRDQLLHSFRYAYRKQADILGRIAAIADGSGHADMIQDLNDIAVLGQAHHEPLTNINLDLAELQNAADAAAQLSDLLARATIDRQDNTRTRIIRDQAYTHLKDAVDEVRACGQYVFNRNDVRMKGYTSQYYRKQSGKSKSVAAAKPASTSTADAIN